MKTNFMNSISRKFGRAGLKLKKHSPELLVFTGIVAGAATVVAACKATTKLNGILEESKEQIDQIHNYIETEGYSEKYTEQDSKKDLTIVYTQTGIKVAKLYLPAIGLGVAATACILSGHNILRKRNAALAIAYTTLENSFKDYRGRVIERFGKKLDHELKYNIQSKEIEEIVVDEKGKEKVVKSAVEVIDPSTISDCSRFFDESCKGFTKDPEANLIFLKHQQAYATDKLRARGHLFLNEVYDLLGIPRTKMGACCGWIYDEKNPVGDNFVDFGLYDYSREKVRDFVNGYERVILLEFNHDGDILNKI